MNHHLHMNNCDYNSYHQDIKNKNKNKNKNMQANKQANKEKSSLS